MDRPSVTETFPLLVLAIALASMPLRAPTYASRADFGAAAATYLALLGEALDAEVASRAGMAAVLRDK